MASEEEIERIRLEADNRELRTRIDSIRADHSRQAAEIERLCEELSELRARIPRIADAQKVGEGLELIERQAAEIAELRKHLSTVMSRESAVQAELAEAKREAAAMAEIRALAFMRNAPAGDVAQHMQSVAESWQRENDALRADLERLRADTVREILIDLRAYCHLEAHKLIYDKYRERNDG